MSGMGFYVTDAVESYPAVKAPPSKNRVWNFFSSSHSRAGFFASQPLETHWKTAPTPTKTASGMSVWLSRDPIEEKGGLNSYGFLNNNAVNDVDTLGEFGLVQGAVISAAIYLVAEQFYFWVQAHAKEGAQAVSLTKLVREAVESRGNSGSFPATLVKYKGFPWPFMGREEVRHPTTILYRCICTQGKRQILVFWRTEIGTYDGMTIDGQGACQ